MKRDNTTIVTALLVIVLTAAGVSIAGGQGGAQIGPVSVFAVCGAFAFVINWLAFIPANAAKTERFYDLTGSLTYLGMMAMAVILTPQVDTRGQLAAMMVAVWAARLGTFLFMRIRKDGKDDRFDEVKVNPLRFFFAWTLQALWALLTAACALAIITGSNAKPIGLVGYLGIIIWLFGFILEVVADGQKRAFKSNPDNEGRFIDTGLWSWSRHPNYFGEMTLWFGMAILAVPVLTGWQWVTIISPFFVVLLITKLSGIPTLKEKAQKRWGDDPDYQAYVERTSLLVPLPPSK